MGSKDRNLFVLTGVGQLRNIMGFIKQYNATNNIAIILYTQRNLDIVANIEKQLDSKQFVSVQLVKLPNRLLEEERKKSIEIYNTLKEVVQQNIETYKINNLFLCSLSNYYSFFKDIIKGRGISINLLEEGLTTYRVYQEDNDQKEYKVSAKDVLSKIKKVFKKLYIIIKPIIVFIKAILELIITIFSFIFRKNIIYYIRKAIRKNKKYKYGLIEQFDDTYVCYPELIEKLNPKIGQVHKLDFNYNNEEVIFTSKEDKENILFINQKYGIRYKEHFPIIFSILQDMGIRKIYMKFHPKEEMENFKEIFDETKAQYPDIEVITLNDYSHIPVENLINANNITEIIALTSSSLFYSKLVNDKIKIISIAEEYKNRCEKIGIPKKRLKAFLKDYEMISRLFPIEQYICDREQNDLSEGDKNGQKHSVYTS